MNKDCVASNKRLATYENLNPHDTPTFLSRFCFHLMNTRWHGDGRLRERPREESGRPEGKRRRRRRACDGWWCTSRIKPSYTVMSTKCERSYWFSHVLIKTEMHFQCKLVLGLDHIWLLVLKVTGKGSLKKSNRWRQIDFLVLRLERQPCHAVSVFKYRATFFHSNFWQNRKKVDKQFSLRTRGIPWV